jgi:MFS family permease
LTVDGERDISLGGRSLAKTTLQLAAVPTMRGRVMALWALAWLGSTPVGGPIVGWVGQVAGARWALVLGGLAALASGALALPALGRIDRRAGRGERAAAARPDAARLPGSAGRGPPARLGRTRPACPARRPRDGRDHGPPAWLAADVSGYRRIAPGSRK